MNSITRNDVQWTALILIPTFSAFYFIIDVIWDLPYTLEVCGICAILSVFFGVVLTRLLRQGQKYDGQIVISRAQNGSNFVLELDGDPYDLQHMDSVTFKVTVNSTEH